MQDPAGLPYLLPLASPGLAVVKRCPRHCMEGVSREKPSLAVPLQPWVQGGPSRGKTQKRARSQAAVGAWPRMAPCGTCSSVKHLMPALQHLVYLI